MVQVITESAFLLLLVTIQASYQASPLYRLHNYLSQTDQVNIQLQGTFIELFFFMHMKFCILLH